MSISNCMLCWGCSLGRCLIEMKGNCTNLLKVFNQLEMIDVHYKKTRLFIQSYRSALLTSLFPLQFIL